MNETLFFRAEDGGEYRLKASEKIIQIEYFHSGSLSTSNSQTECGHTIEGTSPILEFLTVAGFGSTSELLADAENFAGDKWASLHKLIQDNQTSRFLWD